MHLFELGLVDQQPIRLVLQPVLCPAQQSNSFFSLLAASFRQLPFVHSFYHEIDTPSFSCELLNFSISTKTQRINTASKLSLFLSKKVQRGSAYNFHCYIVIQYNGNQNLSYLCRNSKEGRKKNSRGYDISE